MRTIHVLRPRSFRWIFLTFSLPLAVIGIAAAGAESAPSTTAWVLVGITVLARLVLHFVHRLRDDRPRMSDLWLLPVRDWLICWVWCRSFFTSHVTWRGKEFDVDADGVMHPLS
jgi:ceramide glucosyltransferase